MNEFQVTIKVNGVAGPGFAVVDVVTTGFMPETNDRVIEIGVVLVSSTGTIQNEWGTLVNPHRDPGGIHVHGVTSRDLLDAPTFDQIAPRLLESIAGRTVVAHNASFDMRFLHHELSRAGYELTARPKALCSMKWAGRLIGPAKLQHCCDALDIPLEQPHQALSEARATSDLLRHLIHHGRTQAEWQEDIALAQSFQWPEFEQPASDVELASRSSQPPEPDSWMSAVIESTWVAGSPDNEAAYMLALDSALLDRYISASEGAHLIEVARESGLGRDRMISLHGHYLVEMSKVALDDGVVSEEERVDLERIAAALGLTTVDVDTSLEAAEQFHHSAKHASAPGTFLVAGDRVVFTGEMKRTRDAWIDLIVEVGLASGGVTKSTRVLVCADPDSMSGKAGKARGYGVPVVDEVAFERLFAEYCSSKVLV